MTDLEKALDDIALIRTRLAAGTLFQGFGPAVIGLSGVLALLTALAQTLFRSSLFPSAQTYLAVWIVVAAAAALLIGIEMVARSRRHHAGLSTAVIINAIEQFLPAGIAGAAVAAVFYTSAPQNYWMLPGLWQIFVALGTFAATKNLHPTVRYAAAWYLTAGIFVLMIASEDQTLTPWMMGVPFGIGQLLTAIIFYIAEEDSRGFPA
jgi:hypothetical protein